MSIQQNAVIDLYQSGYAVKTVSEVLGIPVSTIYGWLRKRNVVLRSTPNWSKYRKVVAQRNIAFYTISKLTGDL